MAGGKSVARAEIQVSCSDRTAGDGRGHPTGLHFQTVAHVFCSATKVALRRRSGDSGGEGNGIKRSTGKVEPSAGSAFSPPQPQFHSELPPIAGVSATMPNPASATEPVSVVT